MKLCLGIDIGTTKTACSIVDAASGRVVAQASRAHAAATGAGVQDPARHLRGLEALLAELPADVLGRISAIGVTGQMHGILFWSGSATSSLYTWQHAIPPAALAAIQTVAPTLRDGYGLATLAHLRESLSLDSFDHCGSIMDYVVWKLTDRLVTDYSIAASWGAFDMATADYDWPTIDGLGVPRRLFPELVPCGANAGTCTGAFGLPPGIPVMTALGDHQASVAGSSSDPDRELYLTLGTGAQLSAVVAAPVPGIECRPFPGGRLLATAAPLCGGSAWALLEAHARAWRHSVQSDGADGNAPLYDVLDDLALAEIGATDLPIVKPHFLGERSDSSLRGSITGLTLANFTPAKLAAAFALGILRNLRQSFPESLYAGRTVLIVSGNAIRQSRALKTACDRVFNLPSILPDGAEEAACGVARLAGGRAV